MTSVLLWFVVLAPVLVAEVFRSPMVDYRLVAIGAALPLVEIVIGQPLLLHTLLGPVVLLTAVMLGTQRRRLLRRRLLGVPIGVFLHLILAGSWTVTAAFWWPGFGGSIGAFPVPETERSWYVIAVLEVAAVGVGLWAWRRYRLDTDENRRLLWRHGHLARGVLG